MPQLRDNKYVVPYLVYDAPINEGTQKVRDMFDVDPETGYPRRYNDRPLAQLGKEYKPEDLFVKLLPYRKEAMYSTYVTTFLGTVVFSALAHGLYTYKKSLPIYGQPWMIPFWLTVIGGSAVWSGIKAPYRQAQENDMLMDYIKSHPDRFEPVKRYKFREALYVNDLVR